MTKRTLPLVLGTGIAGLGMVASGKATSGYAQAVLLEIGAAFLLATPLVYVGRAFENSVQVAREESAAVATQLASVQEEVRETARRLEELTSATESRLDALAEEDQAAYRDFEERTSWHSVVNLLGRSAALKAIAPGGVRIKVPLMRERLRFSSEPVSTEFGDSRLAVTVEDLAGAVMGQVDWLQSDPPAEIMKKVAEELQRLNVFPGVEAFDASRMFRQLLDTIRTSLDARRRGSALSLAPVIEIPGKQWAVTTDGLQCLEHPYYVDPEQLRTDAMRVHILEKTWVDREDLWNSWQVARALHTSGKATWLDQQ